MGKQDEFRPRCPKCGSLSIGYETDRVRKERYVSCVICSHRTYPPLIGKVFSLQLRLWRKGKTSLPCILDGCESLRRAGYETCSPKCSGEWKNKGKTKTLLKDI